MRQANPHSYLLRPRPYPQRLSVIIPVYNEEVVIPFLREAILTGCARFTFNDDIEGACGMGAARPPR
jgi:hypothetical protein